MCDRDREGDAVHLSDRGRVLVLRVVAHGEDPCLRLSDPLSLEEVHIDPVALKTRAFGSASATRRACSREASIILTLIPWESRTRAIAEPTRPAP